MQVTCNHLVEIATGQRQDHLHVAAGTYCLSRQHKATTGLPEVELPVVLTLLQTLTAAELACPRSDSVRFTGNSWNSEGHQQVQKEQGRSPSSTIEP